jgi:hypothetical protein
VIVSESLESEDEPRISMSDLAEYARENGLDHVPTEREMQALSNDVLGFGNIG